MHARDRFELRFGPTTSTYQTIVGEVNAALDAGRRSATIPSWALLIPRRGARAGEQSARYAWTEDRSRCYVLQRRAPATAASRHALAGYRERWSVVTVVGHVDDERRQLARHYAADVERAERRSRRNTDYRRLRTEAA